MLRSWAARTAVCHYFNCVVLIACSAEAGTGLQSRLSLFPVGWHHRICPNEEQAHPFSDDQWTSACNLLAYASQVILATSLHPHSAKRHAKYEVAKANRLFKADRFQLTQNWYHGNKVRFWNQCLQQEKTARLFQDWKMVCWIFNVVFLISEF